jgi:hypothetical protein
MNYQDDLIILSSENAMIDAIDTVLERCRDNNLVVRLSKCEFFRKELTFLGYTLSQRGIAVPEKRIKTLLDFPFPKTVTEAMRYQGAHQYYSRQTPELSALLSPLSREISKGKNYILTDEIKDGIIKLRETIRNGLNTFHLEYNSSNPNRYIFICADTSLYKTGGVIGNCTMKNGQILDVKIAGYSSKRLNDQETMLSSRARELIGIQAALRSFKDMVPTTEELLIFTDHRSLAGIVHSSGLKGSGSTRTRSAFADLIEYPRSRVFYVPNTHDLIKCVDSLSRVNVSDSEVDVNIFNPKVFRSARKEEEILRKDKSEEVQVNAVKLRKKVQKVDILQIVREQLASKRFSPIQKKLENDESITIEDKVYTKKNNGLYLKTKEGKPLLVIPKTLAYNILENIHVLSCHAGVQGILRQVEQEDVWVESKNKIAAEVCRACILCKLIYRKHEKKSKDQKIRPSFSPYSMAYTDIVEIRSENNTVFNVLSFQDHFSRKVTYRLVRNKESVTVAEALTELITEVGGQGQLTLVSDNGPEFVGKIIVMDESTITEIDFSYRPRLY